MYSTKSIKTQYKTIEINTFYWKGKTFTQQTKQTVIF